MRKLYLTFGTISVSIGCFSQQLELVGAGGAEVTSSAAIFSYSIGELVVATGDSTNFTQGYQQGNLTVTGIDSRKKKLKVSVFPNPAQHSVFVESDQLDAISKLSLFDDKGAIVWSMSDLSGSRHEIDLSGFANGTYTLRVEGQRKSNSATYKIIKTH